MTRYVNWIFYLLLSITVTLGCSDEGPLEVGNPRAEDVNLAGSLKLDNGSPAAGVDVFVESHPEYSDKTDSNGNFGIAGMVPGSYTVYATNTGTLNVKPKAAFVDAGAKGAQFREVIISADERTEIGNDKRLTTPGSVSGNIGLINNPENVPLVGIDVYVPGTGFIAKSGETGNFALSNLPEGFYTIRFERDGLTAFEFEEVEVVSGEDTNLNTVNLSLSNGPSGQIVSLNNYQTVNIDGTGTNVLDQNEVTVNLAYDSRTVLMKLAHESSFLNVDWVPVSQSYTFTTEDNPAAVTDFASDGNKAVYVKFADLNGLESSVYTFPFIIDTENPTVDSFVMFDGWKFSTTSFFRSTATELYSDQAATDNGTGIKEMRFQQTNSCNGNVVDSGWVDFAEFYDQIPWPSATGNCQIGIKVRDWLDNESGYKNYLVQGTSYTLIEAGTHTGTKTLYTEFSPYQFRGDIEFENLIIEEGVELQLDAPSDYGIKITGTLTAVGTAGSPITLTNIGSGGIEKIDLSQSPSEDNLISYWTISGLDIGMTQVCFICINGGEISYLDVSGVTAGFPYPFIQKTGFEFLQVEYNDITWETAGIVRVSEGFNATDIEYNHFTGNNTSIGIIEQNGATGTDVFRNTIEMTGTGSNKGVYTTTGNIDVDHNNFVASGSGAVIAVQHDAVGEHAFIDYNNVAVSDHVSSIHYMYNGSGATFYSRYNYFSGCSSNCSNPTFSGTITNSFQQGSPYATTGGGSCAGHLCD